MINTPAEYDVSIRNLAILEAGLEQLRNQLESTNPALFAATSQAYMRRIALHRDEIEQYRRRSGVVPPSAVAAKPTELLTGEPVAEPRKAPPV